MQTNVIDVIFLLSLDHLRDLHLSCSKPFQRARAGTTALYSAISADKVSPKMGYAVILHINYTSIT